MSVRMPSTLACLLVLLITTVTPETANSAPQPNLRGVGPAQMLTAEQAVADVELLGRALRAIHPGYSRYTSRLAMDALLRDLQARSQSGTTDVDLYREVSAILAKIRCDHTKAELPPALEEFRNRVPSYLPFSFRIFDGRMYVDRRSESASELQRGDEIIQINGLSVGRILAEVAEHVSVDGWTDDTKFVEMEYSTEYLGGAVDHFWPFFYGWPESWTIEYRSAGLTGTTSSGETGKPLQLDPLSYPDWLVMASGSDEKYLNFPDSIEYRALTDSTVYLSIGTFVNYRKPVSPESLFDPIFDRIRNGGFKHLILDLRSCGGGSDEVPESLTTYLSATPVSKSKRAAWVRNYRFGDLRSHLSTWDDSVFDLPAEFFGDLGNGFYEFVPPRQETQVSPRGNRFEGSLTVLSSAANASGATILIALLQEHCSARVVGTPTGGSSEGPTAGVLFTLTLPESGIMVRIPVLRSWLNLAEPSPGRGVSPDLVVTPTFQDWIQDYDRALEVALEAD